MEGTASCSYYKFNYTTLHTRFENIECLRWLMLQVDEIQQHTITSRQQQHALVGIVAQLERRERKKCGKGVKYAAWADVTIE